MAEVGSVTIKLKLDKSEFDKSLKALSSGNLGLKIKVDDKALTALNKHLDLKKKHFDEVQAHFNKNPLNVTTKIDLSRFKKQLEELKSLTKGIEATVGFDAGGLEKSIEQAFTNALRKAKGNPVVNGFKTILSAPLKGASFLGGSVVQGLAIGITSKLSTDFGKGLSDAIQKATGKTVGSSELLGEKAGQGIVRGIEKAVSKLGDKLPEKLKEKLGDLGTELENSIKSALGEVEVTVAQASQSAKSSAAKKRTRENAAVGLNEQRREALRAKSDTTDAINVAKIEGRVVEVKREASQKRLDSVLGKTSEFYKTGVVPAEFSEQFPELKPSQVSEKYEEFLKQLNKDINEQILVFQQAEQNFLIEIRQLEKTLAEQSALSQQIKSQQKAITPSINKTYKAAAREVLGKNIDDDRIPQLRTNDLGLAKAGAKAQYNVESNSIEITSELAEALEAGKLTLDQFETLFEELYHAAQFDTGSVEGVEARRNVESLLPVGKPTVEEFQQIAPELEGYSPELREVELQAKTLAKRKAKSRQQKAESDRDVAELTKAYGLGGIELEKAAGAKLTKAIARLKAFGQLADQAGLSFEKEISILSEAISELSDRLRGSLQKIASIQIEKPSPELFNQAAEVITAQFAEIEEIQERIESTISPTLPSIKIGLASAKEVKADLIKPTVGDRVDIVPEQLKLVKSSASIRSVEDAKKAAQTILTSWLQARNRAIQEAKAYSEINEEVADTFNKLSPEKKQRIKARAEKVLESSAVPPPEDDDEELTNRRLNLPRNGFRNLKGKQRERLKNIINSFDRAEENADKVDSAYNRGVRETNDRTKNANDAINAGLRDFADGVEPIGKLDKALVGLGGTLSSVVKGFLSFQVLQFFAANISKAYDSAIQVATGMELLENRLKFVAGSAFAASKAIANITNESIKLNSPLQSAIESFTKFQSATKGTDLESQTTGIFNAVNQAATVYRLTADQTQGAFLALQQMASKGKISAEEFRGQLAERLPGASAIAARSLGVTTAEFNKLLDSGSLVVDDFLPKFARQLSAETNSGVAGAANTAFGATNRLNNAIFTFQSGLGEAGLPLEKFTTNLKSLGLETLNKNIGTFSRLLIGLSIGFTIALIKPIAALLPIIGRFLALAPGVSQFLGFLLAQLPKLALLFKNLAIQTALVFSAFEVFDKFKIAFNGDETVQEFRKVQDAAKQLAKDLDKIKNPKVETTPTQPQGSGGLFGISDSIVQFNEGIYKNLGINVDLVTYGELERDRLIEQIGNNSKNIGDAITDSINDLNNKSRQNKLNLVPDLDKQIFNLSRQRAVLQSRIKSEFTLLGKTAPQELTQQVSEITNQINSKQEEKNTNLKPTLIRKQFLEETRSNLKQQLNFLNSSEGVKKFGDTNLLNQQKQVVNRDLVDTEKQLFKINEVLASTNSDPILGLIETFRKLNNQLATTQELFANTFDVIKLNIVNKQIGDYFKNPLASRQAELAGTIAEKENTQSQITILESSTEGRRNKLETAGVGLELDRISGGLLNTSSTATEIQSIIDRPGQDLSEPDKKFLEDFKDLVNDEKQLRELRVTNAENNLKVIRQIEQNTIAEMQSSADKAEAIVKQSENNKLADIVRNQAKGKFTDEQAGLLTAGINFDSSQRRLTNLDNQLSVLREYYNQQKIGAEEFNKQERGLLTQRSEFVKKLADDELAYVNARRSEALATLERTNRKAIILIETRQSKRDTGVLKELLGTNLNSNVEAQAQRLQTVSSNTGLDEKITTKQQEIPALNKENYKNEEEYLIIRAEREKELADLIKQRTQGQIDLEKQNQAISIKAIDERIAKERTYGEVVSNTYENQKKILDFYSNSLDRTRQLVQSQADLNSAIKDYNSAVSNSLTSGVDKAIELTRRLNDKNTSKEERGAIKQALGTLGYVGSEYNLLQQKQAIESRIASQKLNALKEEQVIARQLFDIDIKRQKIQAQQAVTAARQNLVQARIGGLEARGELEKSLVNGTDTEKAIAKEKLGLANDNIGFAELGLQDALQGLGIQEQLATNSRTALGFKQAAESINLNTDIRNQSVDTTLGLATANKKGRFVSLFDQAQANYWQQNQQLTVTPTASTSSSGGNTFTGMLKEANAGIESKLDVTNTLLASALDAPRTLNVSSPNPVSDGAKIYNEIARYSTIAAGLN